MEKVKKIFIDCDGVLTDDKIWITSTGEISKGFNTKDIRSIRELISNGFEVYIVTASSWPGTEMFAKKTGAEVIIERDKSKIDCKGQIIVVNDSWDIPMAKKAGYVFVPKDCIPYYEKMDRAVYFMKTKGGAGVIAEVLENIIEIISGNENIHNNTGIEPTARRASDNSRVGDTPF